MIKWIKNNWKDPVWSKVFASTIIAAISGAWILIQTLIKRISLQESINQFWIFLNIKINLPLWSLFLLFLVALFFTLKIFLKKLVHIKASTNKEKNKKSNTLAMECPHNYLATEGFASSINTQFLNTENGIFNVWGYVNDDHNKIYPKRRHMYLLGYATNNGISLKNPSTANYPNAWAISRLTPTNEDNLGKWRFWCNNISKDLTHLDYSKMLTGGWHLFTISWSKTSNYIKFIIDNDIVVEDSFKNWPTDYSGSLMLGTWSNKASVHYFNSKVGHWKFIEKEYNYHLINEYFENKPK